MIHQTKYLTEIKKRNSFLLKCIVCISFIICTALSQYVKAQVPTYFTSNSTDYYTFSNLQQAGVPCNLPAITSTFQSQGNYGYWVFANPQGVVKYQFWVTSIGGSGGEPAASMSGTAEANCPSRMVIQINWNSGFIGKARLWFRLCQNNGGCEPGQTQEFPLADYCVNTTGNAGISIDNSSPIILSSGSNTRTMTVTPQVGNIAWYVKTPGSANFVYDNAINYSHTVTLTTPGTYQYYARQDFGDCGARNSVVQSIVVKPSCVLSSLIGPGGVIAANPENNAAAVLSGTNVLTINGGYTNMEYNNLIGTYESLGGYRVTTGQPFLINLKGIVDLTQHYDLQFNAPSFLNPNTPPLSNNSQYTVSSTFGSYRFTFAKKQDGVDRSECPTIPDIRVFTGGSDVVIPPSKCPIILPDYFCQGTAPLDPGASCNGSDLIFQVFQWTIISQSGIRVKSGVNLVDGANLKIREVETPIDKTLPDNQITWSETTTFDDEGNILSTSRSYFNDQGRPTQAQVKNLTGGVVLATEQLYDRFNRPSLTTLSAPIASLSAQTQDANGCTLSQADRLGFQYKQNFITTTTNTRYTYQNFDGVHNPAKESQPDKLNTATPGTLGWYYGPANTTAGTMAEPNVAKTSYPFSRTQYYNDGTQEVKHQVGPGDIYRSPNTYQHVATAKLLPVEEANPDIAAWIQMRAAFTSTPIPSALVGNAAKQNLTDEHGIQSYTITDKEGRQLIAVYISTNPQTNLPVKTYSFNYYDDAGRLLHSITPNGVDAFLNGGIPFADIDKTSYVYNHRGWLLSISEPDAGRTDYKYRRDGNIRFSQNALQRSASPERYSYTNYDLYDRAIESGEYSANPDGIAWAAITQTILEDRTSSGGLTGGLKTDVSQIYYDGENGTYTAPYPQNFVLGKVSCTAKPGETQTWYSYDERARLVWRAQQIPGLGIKKIDYTYTPSGSVKEVAYQKGQPGEEFYHIYEYDQDNRLKTVYTTTTTPTYTNGSPTNATKQAEYQYYLHGPLKRVVLANNLQGIDYLYTVEGWLKAINHYDKTQDPGADTDDAFGITFDYYTGDYSKNGITTMAIANTNVPDRYNGIIKNSAWFSEKPGGAIGVTSDPVAYAYTYDDKYQLRSATWGTVAGAAMTGAGTCYQEGSIAYDLNGNISTLKRYGTSSLLHDFQYQYTPNKNQLQTVANAAGPDATYASYQYDAIGQLKAQTKANSTIYARHNVMGLMASVAANEDQTNALVKYYYDDAGLRYKKETYHPVSHILTNTTWYTHDDAGSVMSIYEQDHTQQSSQPQLTETPIYGADRVGTLYRSPNKYYYELKDHLGNVRTLLSRTAAGQKEVVAYTDYYPFGMKLRSYSGAFYRYGYQGQYAEADPETGYNSFELRMYDPAIGRWLSVDPKRDEISPYLGMGNNPVSHTDPDGGSKNPIANTKGDIIGSDDLGYEGKAIVMDEKNFVQGMKHEDALKYNLGVGGFENDAAKLNFSKNYSGLNTSSSKAFSLAFPLALERASVPSISVSAIGLGLITLAAAITTSDTRQEDNNWNFFHYTDAKGYAAIISSMRILPNTKGKVYISDVAMGSTEVFNNIFLGQPTHRGRGDYVVSFSLTNYQRAQLEYNPMEPYEFAYPGVLKIHSLNYHGPNIY